MSDQLPVENLKDAIPFLRRPFTPGAVKFKVQSVAGNRGMVVAYIDARLVIERLNTVIPDRWFDEYERFDGKWMRCNLTVDGITRCDVGTGNDPKAMWSDSLKRAGVHFGIGVANYGMKQIWLPVTEKGAKGELRKTRNSKGEDSAAIPPDTDTHLRGLYAAWLNLDRGGKVFGEALDHGDDPEGSVGEAADSAEPEQTALDYTDPKEAEEQVARIREFHDSVDWAKRPAGDRITKSRLNAMLSGANGDGDLNKIEAHIVEKAGQGS
jgi:hypothetical protein